jgi:hypothetical protein
MLHLVRPEYIRPRNRHLLERRLKPFFVQTAQTGGQILRIARVLALRLDGLAARKLLI